MTLGVKVLIIEDDDAIRTALRMALEDEGFVVEAAQIDTTSEAFLGNQPQALSHVGVITSGINLGRQVERAT